MRYLVSGKKGTFFIEKPYISFDLIHDEGVFKHIRDKENEKVKEVEIKKPSIVKGYSFIPTVLSLKIDKGNNEFTEVIVRYPFASAYRTAKVVAEGKRVGNEIQYTKVYPVPIDADTIAIGEGFTFKELKKIYERLQTDDLSMLHNKWKDKPFNAEELIKDLQELFEKDRREFVYLTGRRNIKDISQVKIAEETLAGKVAKAVFKALKGEKTEGIEITPLNGMLVGVSGSPKSGNLFPVISMYPNRVKLASTTYLGKTLVKNRDYTRLRVLLRMLNSKFIKTLEENTNLEELKEFKEAKIEKIEKLKNKLENEKYKKLVDYIIKDIRYNNIESLKNNINKLKREVDSYFNQIMEEEEIINYTDLFAKTKEGYFLRNQIHNVGIDDEYGKELLTGLPPQGDKRKDIAILTLPVPRVIKDKDGSFTTKLDFKPKALLNIEDGEINNVKELNSDLYAKMFEEKIYRRLKFIENAKSFEQAKALIGDGFDKYKGLNELKTQFANKKIAIGYVEFVDYLQKKLSQANSLEEIKKIIQNDKTIREFKEKMEAYENSKKIVEAFLSTEKGNEHIVNYIENLEKALKDDEDLQKHLRSFHYNLMEAALGQIQYRIDSKKLQAEIEKRKREAKVQDIEIELTDFDEIIKSEIVNETIASEEGKLSEKDLKELETIADELLEDIEKVEMDYDPLGPEL